MHGRGSQASAPASDAAGRGDAGGTPQTARPSRVVPRRATWRIPTRADAGRRGQNRRRRGRNRADSAEIGPNRSVSAVSAISAGDRYGRNMPESAGIGRNRPKSAVKIAREAEILASDAFLALFFLCFVNQIFTGLLNHIINFGVGRHGGHEAVDVCPVGTAIGVVTSFKIVLGNHGHVLSF
uniref:Uncharacterized protein n=1 Tax=Quercus lobata TaxID=97700 RepID=A0A7N2KSU1_QUELO